MPVQHGANIGSALTLASQVGTAIHQMPGVQQDTFIGIADTVQQPFCLPELREGKARPPLVFHQEGKGPLFSRQQLVDKL